MSAIVMIAGTEHFLVLYPEEFGPPPPLSRKPKLPAYPTTTLLLIGSF